MAFSYSKSSSAVRRLFADSDDDDCVSLPPIKNGGGKSNSTDMEIEETDSDDQFIAIRPRRIIDDFDRDSDSCGDSGRLTSSQEGRIRLFNHTLFQEWNKPNSGCIDIPVLIMDLEGLRRNKDLDAIPRFYANQMRCGSGRGCEGIPFLLSEERGKFISLNEIFREFGFSGKSRPTASKFRDLIEKKPRFDEMMDFYQGVNIFIYSTFLLKQFAPILGLIDQFYSPISDEAKYYFYILFDYLRRKAIDTGSLFLKRDVIRIVRDLGSLEGYVLTQDLVLRKVHGIKSDLFDIEHFRFLDGSEPFTISA